MCLCVKSLKYVSSLGNSIIVTRIHNTISLFWVVVEGWASEHVHKVSLCVASCKGRNCEREGGGSSLASRCFASATKRCWRGGSSMGLMDWGSAPLKRYLIFVFWFVKYIITLSVFNILLNITKNTIIKNIIFISRTKSPKKDGKVLMVQPLNLTGTSPLALAPYFPPT